MAQVLKNLGLSLIAKDGFMALLAYILTTLVFVVITCLSSDNYF